MDSPCFSKSQTPAGYKDIYDGEPVLHLKWRHGDRWRRFAIPKSGISFAVFMDFLKTAEPNFDGRIGYIDDEGDFVRISSTSGIDELIHVCESMKLSVIYLHSTEEQCE